MTRFVIKYVRLKIVKEREKSGDLDVVGLVIQGAQIMTVANTNRSILVQPFRIVMY
jgi:hypothetical protein